MCVGVKPTHILRVLSLDNFPERVAQCIEDLAKTCGEECETMLAGEFLRMVLSYCRDKTQPYNLDLTRPKTEIEIKRMHYYEALGDHI